MKILDLKTPINSKVLEKLVFLLISLLPLALTTSIFVADLFSSIIALVALFWIFKKNEFFKIIENIKIPLCLIFLFYIVILLSLIFSENFQKSFLPSFLF